MRTSSSDSLLMKRLRIVAVSPDLPRFLVTKIKAVNKLPIPIVSTPDEERHCEESEENKLRTQAGIGAHYRTRAVGVPGAAQMQRRTPINFPSHFTGAVVVALSHSAVAIRNPKSARGTGKYIFRKFSALAAGRTGIGNLTAIDRLALSPNRLMR